VVSLVDLEFQRSRLEIPNLTWIERKWEEVSSQIGSRCQE